MKNFPLLFAAALLLALSAAARAEDATVTSPKIRPKHAPAAASSDSTLPAETDVVDAPTSAVLDDHGYSTRSRVYSQGGILEYLSFGAYPGVNLGVSAAMDGF